MHTKTYKLGVKSRQEVKVLSPGIFDRIKTGQFGPVKASFGLNILLLVSAAVSQGVKPVIVSYNSNSNSIVVDSCTHLAGAKLALSY